MTQTQTTKATNGKPPIQKIDDYVQTGLVAVYLVQKLGQPTLEEIKTTARDRLGAQLDGRTLARALKGASRAGRNLISVLQTRLPEDRGGSVVDCFSMKDPQRWKAPPEFAHIMDLLPKLLADPQAQEIKSFFDAGESGDKSKEKKARRGNDVDEYRNYTVYIKTLDTLLGSQIHCPFTDKARGEGARKNKDEKPEMEGIFVVDELTGNRVLTPDCLQGWFTTNAGRYAGMPDARGQYIAFKPVQIDKSIKPIQLILPVNNSKQGASAPKSYEAIPGGQILRMDFTAPSKGFFGPLQLEKLFHLAGDRPRRGISPARGKRYGRFMVLKFIDRGPVKSGSMDFILDNLPADVRKKITKTEHEPMPTEVTEEHYRYIAEAAVRLKDVVIEMGSKPTEADGTFPSSDPDEEDDDE